MDPAAADPPPRRRRLLLPLVLAALAAAVLWWLFRDRDETGVVAAMRWTHTTQLQRWQDVSRSGWRQDLVVQPGVSPVRGVGEQPAVRLLGCTSKLHHQESFACGVETYTRREEYRCGTERRCKRVRRARGDRVRHVEDCEEVPRKCHRDIPEDRTKICTRPVHADWCEVVTQEWFPVRSEKLEGDAHLGMRFPELPPADDLERNQTSASYTLTIVHAGGQHTAVVERPEYDRWNPGDPVALRLETVGGVLAFDKPSASKPAR